MGKETFLRLPEEKRNRFLESAWQEFTNASFADASINRIIHRAQVPRGSFYQYFADKEDLFAYLVDIARTHILKEYRSMVVKGGGDLFQAQMLCYDRFVSQTTHHPDIIFDRTLMMLRKNAGIHLQVLLPAQPECAILGIIWDDLDRSMFRLQDRMYVQNVFLLTLLALAAMVMDTLNRPERAEENRTLLLQQLEIIKQGCLAENSFADPRRGGHYEE